MFVFIYSSFIGFFYSLFKYYITLFSIIYDIDSSYIDMFFNSMDDDFSNTPSLDISSDDLPFYWY